MKVNIFLDTESLVKIELYDLTGKLLHQLAAQYITSGDNLLQLDVRHFSTGLYIAKTISGDKTYYTKLSKQ
jgi:hypothetical protein